MLETKELVLKSGAADDWNDLYHNLWSHGSVFQYMFTRASDSEEAARKRTAAYAQMHKEVDTEFFVYEKRTGQAVGIAGIKDLGDGIFTVTDIAVGPAFMGSGYGKQILEALQRLAFEDRGASELYYDCFEENLASKRLALSCGFVYTHSKSAELKKNGKTVMLMYFKHSGKTR